ncbi:Zn-dependent hydrolase [Ruminococcaceae bacterium OttesenSCG-928-D13]|nr:Zn-dependent hydrolase [Ruminococcaceae bacterium OttesenSCG-928-D13]
MSRPDAARVLEQLKRLDELGRGPGEGAFRMAYSPAFDAGRDYVRGLMEDAGLVCAVDAVGNLTGRLEGGGGPVIAVGSHLDTVPNGGLYDGALGVLCAVECLRALGAEGRAFRHGFEVIGFTEEEGNVIGGLFGSRCFTGAPVTGVELEKLAAHGLGPAAVAAAKRRMADYLCYLELHIEQGGILEGAGYPLGVVEGIAAIHRWRVTVDGQANHAGSTPMWLRDDALEKACRLIVDLMDAARAIDRRTVCTVGTLEIEQPAVNVIPGRVCFTVDLRHPDPEPLERVVAEVRGKYPNVLFEQILNDPSTVCAPGLRRVFEAACTEAGTPAMPIHSGAGHDAIQMARHLPVGMLFVPSVGGISHSPREYSRPQDIAAGLDVLYRALQKLDEGGLIE